MAQRDPAAETAASRFPSGSGPLPEGAAPRLSPGDVLGARYEIVRFLARGGMGEVYRGVDLELGIAVALKVIRAELASDVSALRRFKREVLLARSVSHPGICRLFDFG